MSDIPPDSPGEPGQAGGAERPGAVPFAINMQYVKDLSFENPRAPVSFHELQGAPEVNVNINVDARKLEEGTYEVLLTVTAEARHEAETVFLVELSYGGVAAVGAGIPEEHVRPIVMIEGPRLMFPFARNIIATATRDGGYPPLLVQPIDFVELYRQKYAMPGDAAGGEAPSPEGAGAG